MGRKRRALVHFVAGASGAPASSCARAASRRPPIVAGATMGETMRVLTIVELLHLTKIELCNLVAKVVSDIPMLVEGTQQRPNALTSLRNIRFVLARRHFTPCVPPAHARQPIPSITEIRPLIRRPAAG
jgi:hypothetical protein